MTVTAPVEVGCDCEPVTPRLVSTWRDLLGAGGFALAELVSREMREELDRAATRIWCALECVKKAGIRRDAGIVFSTAEENAWASSGWVVLVAGGARIATVVARVAESEPPLAFAVLVSA